MLLVILFSEGLFFYRDFTASFHRLLEGSWSKYLKKVHFRQNMISYFQSIVYIFPKHVSKQDLQDHDFPCVCGENKYLINTKSKFSTLHVAKLVLSAYVLYENLAREIFG